MAAAIDFNFFAAILAGLLFGCCGANINYRRLMVSNATWNPYTTTTTPKTRIECSSFCLLDSQCTAFAFDKAAGGPCQQADSLNSVGISLEGTYVYVTEAVTTVDANWGAWGEWGACSLTCATGSRTRQRTCGTTQHGGFEICQNEGSATETGSCNTQPCPYWTEWSAWAVCSVTCAGGTQDRTRQCYDPNTNAEAPATTYCSTDAASETQACNEQVCPSWQDWSAWSTCTKTCGTGSWDRSRICWDTANSQQAPATTDCSNDPASETGSCNTLDCPYWKDWTAWTTCSLTCASGTQDRDRVCWDPNTSAARPLPTDCTTDPYEETQSCNTQDCPYWTAWDAWGTCSLTCASGTQSRSRECYDPNTSAPAPATTDCSTDSATSSQACNTQVCPSWQDWSAWSTCTKTCGTGSWDRSRVCWDTANSQQAAASTDCGTDPASETGSCNTLDCPYWKDWSAWTACSLTCATGTQDRSRVCWDPNTSAQTTYPTDCTTDPYEETQNCNTQDCPAWNTWSAWDTCTLTCNSGTQDRTRSCIDPVTSQPTTYPTDCSPDSPTQTQDCNTGLCPVVCDTTLISPTTTHNIKVEDQANMPITCGVDRYLRRFQMWRPAGNTMRYNYTCCYRVSPGSCPSPTRHTLGWATIPSTTHNYNAMVNYNVACPSGERLNDVVMGFTSTDIRFVIDCCPMSQAGCATKYTQWDEYGGWDTVYQDRHDISCADNEYLTGYILRHDGGTQVRFEYTCCYD